MTRTRERDREVAIEKRQRATRREAPLTVAGWSISSAALVLVTVPGGGTMSLQAERYAFAFKGTLFSIPPPKNPPYYGPLSTSVSISLVNDPNGSIALGAGQQSALAIPTLGVAHSTRSSDLGAVTHVVSITIPSLAAKPGLDVARQVGTPQSTVEVEGRGQKRRRRRREGKGKKEKKGNARIAWKKEESEEAGNERRKKRKERKRKERRKEETPSGREEGSDLAQGAA